jgi:hypothetical protein
MPAHGRLKRDPLPRSGPIRNPSARVRPDPVGPFDSEEPARRRRRGSSRRPSRVMENAEATILDAATRGVETAYTICEEYLRRGREAARRLQHASYLEADMSYGRRCSSDWPGAWGPTGPTMAPWMQMARMWSDWMGAFVPGMAAMGSAWGADPYGYGGGTMQGGPCGHGPGCGCGSPSHSARMGSQSRIPVQVQSKNPVEVTLDLEPGAECSSKLDAGDVRGESGRSDVLPHAEFLNRGGRKCLSVQAEDNVLPGRYCAEVYDDCGADCGVITIQVHKGP